MCRQRDRWPSVWKALPMIGRACWEVVKIPCLTPSLSADGRYSLTPLFFPESARVASGQIRLFLPPESPTDVLTRKRLAARHPEIPAVSAKRSFP